MPRTREQLAQAATNAEVWLDSLDPSTTPADDIGDLRGIAAAVADVADADRRLADTVATARDNGRSWSRIAMVLGVSKQAARQRYSDRSLTES
jgi:hypothetical protein